MYIQQQPSKFAKFGLDEHTNMRMGIIEALLAVKNIPNYNMDEAILRNHSFVAEQIAGRIIAQIPESSHLYDYLEKVLPDWINASIVWEADATKFVSTQVQIPKEKLAKFQNLDDSPMSKKELLNYLNQAWSGLAEVYKQKDKRGSIGLMFWLKT